MDEVFIRVYENRWRGLSYSFRGGFYPTADAAMKAEDAAHQCGRLCDYCKAKWRHDGNEWRRYVDYDGAPVTHRVVPFKSPTPTEEK